jgi:Flp pilus assembly pilin Flp
MRGLIGKLVDRRCGAVSVEYALTAGLVGVATALALAGLGDALDQAYVPPAVVTGQSHHVATAAPVEE